MSKPVKVKVINDSNLELPAYAHKGDAGIDLRADLSTGFNELTADGAAWDDVSKCVRLFPGGRCLISTGIRIELPEGYELQIRPRSGLALKNGISVLNSPGTIDSGYKNLIGVILINHSQNDFEIYNGDRIAQAVLNKVEQIEWEPVTEFKKTERGLKGFGSSGVK